MPRVLTPQKQVLTAALFPSRSSAGAGDSRSKHSSRPMKTHVTQGRPLKGAATHKQAGQNMYRRAQQGAGDRGWPGHSNTCSNALIPSHLSHNTCIQSTIP